MEGWSFEGTCAKLLIIGGSLGGGENFVYIILSDDTRDQQLSDVLQKLGNEMNRLATTVHFLFAILVLKQYDFTCFGAFAVAKDLVTG